LPASVRRRYATRMRAAVVASLALALALAGPVLAQDKCLTGSSTLPDQRDLADLRAAVEAACPCASAVSRRDWQACARGVVKSALAAGDLRPECKRTATGIDKGAVCGSTKIACGRYTPGAAAPLSCRVRAADECDDGRRFTSEACSNETHCADVVDWTASTCIDVRQNGPFVPGIHIIDYTKQSVATYCTGGTGNCGTMPFGANCHCSGDAECQSGVCET